jgi:hypothetical protein
MRCSWPGKTAGRWQCDGARLEIQGQEQEQEQEQIAVKRWKPSTELILTCKFKFAGGEEPLALVQKSSTISNEAE